MFPLVKSLRMPVKFKKFYSELSDHSFKILDVGCGNHSPSQCKKYFPYCCYYGIDKQEYNINESDKQAMTDFYAIDLDHDSLDIIPSNFFDVIIGSHVIEHLQNPLKVVEQLSHKLKKGGRIYFEFPSLRSLGLPSMEGTMQFCDDATHVYIPNPYDIINCLLRNHIKIVDAKTRCDWFRLVSSPLFLISNVYRDICGKSRKSRGLWDLFGFAYYIYGIKMG